MRTEGPLLKAGRLLATGTMSLQHFIRRVLTAYFATMQERAVGTGADRGGAARSNSPTAALKTLRRQFSTQEFVGSCMTLLLLVRTGEPSGLRCA